MRRIITLLVVCLFSMPLLLAQAPRCGHQHAMQYQAQQDIAYEQAVLQTFENAKQVFGL